MAPDRGMSYHTLLLELWLAGARIYLEDGDRLGVEAPLTDELRAAIRRHKPRLLELARRAQRADGRLALPARDYIAMFWAPRTEWRTSA